MTRSVDTLVHPTPYLSDTPLLRPASILILSLLLIDPSEAQIQLDRFFPCVVTAGTPTKVKAEGKFPVWPIEIICDREDVQWQVGEESGQLEFTVDENAAQGVAWVRVMDKTSSSDLIPLLITNTQTLSETEPNQNPKDANRVTTPICIVGRLEKRGDLDGFRFEAKRDERFNISLTANRILASPMDAVLQISDPKGNVLFQEDDTLGLDPHIRFLCPEDGEYLVRVFAFPETPNST
ncbi:MAG: PPC domain-containing protein, partial [Planctomycetota bacterium]|nr:PPC domain-containing protein [Planctomycetota bacterium]